MQKFYPFALLFGALILLALLSGCGYKTELTLPELPELSETSARNAAVARPSP